MLIFNTRRVARLRKAEKRRSDHKFQQLHWAVLAALLSKGTHTWTRIMLPLGVSAVSHRITPASRYLGSATLNSIISINVSRALTASGGTRAARPQSRQSTRTTFRSPLRSTRLGTPELSPNFPDGRGQAAAARSCGLTTSIASVNLT